MIYPDKFINKVLCGDCLDIMPFIPDETIDLIVTDPPYGDNYKSNRQTRCGRTGTELKVEREEYFTSIVGDAVLPTEWIKLAYTKLRENSALYVFCKWNQYSKLETEILKAGFKIKNLIIMNKSNHGMGDLKGQYAPKHELLVFASKGRHILRFHSRQSDVWDVKVKYSGSHRYHPNEKSVEWILPTIINSSEENDIVLDPFVGSGTTLIACKKTRRNFIGIEIDRRYAEIARSRINELE